MFIVYLFTHIKNVFWTWIILTLLNQIIFFGACLAPYCILASIPHVSLITFVIMYFAYKVKKGGETILGYDFDGKPIYVNQGWIDAGIKSQAFRDAQAIKRKEIQEEANRKIQQSMVELEEKLAKIALAKAQGVSQTKPEEA